jgi:hypothetical protein
MANVYAVKSGDWSDPTVWNTGVLPTSADDVYSNGYTVSVDISSTVISVSNSAASPIVAGGFFDLLDGVTLTANVSQGGVTTPTVQLNQPSPASASIIGTMRGSLLGSSDFRAVRNNNSGILNVVGDCFAGSRSGCDAVQNASSGVVNIIGNCRHEGGNIAGPPAAANNLGSGTINITGNCSTNTGQSSGHAVLSQGTGTVNIVGSVSSNGPSTTVSITTVAAKCNITGNCSSSTGLAIANSGILDVAGTVSASTSRPVVSSSPVNATNIFSGPLINNGRINAILCARFRFKPNTPARWRIFQRNGDGLDIIDRTLYTAGDYPDMPAPADVRAATAFGPGSTLTGALAMPAPSSVRSGVPVDDTVGTATLDAAAFWDALIANMNTSGSIGARLKNAATVETTGDQWATG